MALGGERYLELRPICSMLGITGMISGRVNVNVTNGTTEFGELTVIGR